jgi:hypothetical protein
VVVEGCSGRLVSLTPPRKPMGGTTGSEAFGEDVGNLFQGGEITELNVAVGDLFEDEMNINFHVFGSYMGHGVGGQG